MKKDTKFLVIYLTIAFGVCWGVGIAYLFFSDIFVPITGELTLMHPVAIIALYSPSIAGIVTYFIMGGFAAVKGLFSKLVPRKEDLFWFPILLVLFVLFAATMHFGSKLFGLDVPVISRTLPGVILKIFTNLFEETGLIGGVFGWIGFLLPFLQRKFKNNIAAGLVTGFLLGLWVLPGYLISSFGTATSYPFYVIQLMFFVLFSSYIFNATKGNILFYLFSFWLAATGSQIELYYFNPPVQIMQIVFFMVAALVVHILFKKFDVDQELQLFPEFVQKEPALAE